MRAFVGVTDTQWYQFLAARPHLSEVNFWRPSGRGFGAIAIGEPFLFKTHRPHDRLVGGGFFSSSHSMKLSDAWEIFGEANGASTLAEMRAAIAKYLSRPLSSDDDPEIGCVFLRDVFFVQPSEGLAPPPDFASNIVMGKRYDLNDANGSVLEGVLRQLLYKAQETRSVPGPVFGDPRLVAPRLGQQAFKALVLEAYDRRCAVSGAKIRPTLQAAHIRPVTAGGEHRVDNGLLLRSDIHTLFDRGYLGVDPAHRLRVSPRLRLDFGNGEEYYTKQGNPLVVLPSRRADRPNVEALAWHLDTVFKSA